MSKITAAEVNKLRQATGAGMMDCKNALVEAEGDFDKAIEVLRKKGQKVAEKRADRESAEGAAIAKVNAAHTKGAIISLNCETDFVAKNESFVALANELAELALNYNDKEAFLAAPFQGITVADKLTEQTGVIGEKIEIGQFEVLEGKYVDFYIHAGNKIAALVSLSAAIDKGHEVARNVCMQVASMGAIVLTPEVLKQAEEEAKEELKAEGKPEKIWDRILPGKVQRFIDDNTTLDLEKALLDQYYIKDESKKVADYVKGYNVEITGFKRVSLV